MAVATLTRGGNTIELPLVSEGSGGVLIAVDHGKPLAAPASEAFDPMWIDRKSQLQTYTLGIRFTDSNAYDDAIALADMIKSHSQGEELLLNLPVDEYEDDIPVAPAAGQEEALSLVYEPGRTGWVDAELGLTRVDHIFAASDPPSTHVMDTEPVSGDGPIRLSYSTDMVELTSDVTVERAVGRPNSPVDPKYKRWPDYQDNIQSAYDTFEFNFQFGEDAVSDTSDLIDMVTTRLDRNGLLLSFNGVYNLGQYRVVPVGSGALRTVRSSGEQGWTREPNLSLRVITAAN